MKFFFAIFLICFVTSSKSQLLVDVGTQVSINNQSNLYTDAELVNKGEIVFASTATGGLFIDAGLNNLDGTLTLNDAILHLGSNTSRADGNHNLIFGSDDYVKFVELGKTTGIYTVTGGLLNITNSLTSNSGTLEANNRVVLKSTSIFNTALVPESLDGVLNGIRVERFIPAKRAWRLMASPVTTDEFIFENWQQNGLEVGDSGYRANVGTHITGGTSNNGFDQSGSNNPSMYFFNVQDQQWNAIANTNATKLEISDAYFMLIRGDRSISLTTNDLSEIETTLEQTGSLHIGSKSKTFNTPFSESFVTIANPYQAPVDMNAVIGTTNPAFKNQIWIWIQTDVNSGQFVNISDLDNPTPSIPGSNVSRDLQPGQSGFIQTKSSVSGNVTLTFNEADKVDSTNLTETFSVENNFTSQLDGFLRIGLYNINSTPFTDVAYDGVILKFGNQYNNTIDDFDAIKLFNSEESLAIPLNETYLSVNNRKLPENLDEVIDVSLFNLSQNQYVLSIELEGFASLPNGIFLWDKYLDTYTALNDQDLINFSVDASVPESIAENRFALVFEEETMGVENQFLSDVKLFPNPVVEEYLTIQFSETLADVKTEIEIFSINGILVRSEVFENNQQRLELKNLNFSTGVYVLKIKQGGTTNTFKIIKE